MPDANSLAFRNRPGHRCRPARHLALFAALFLLGCTGGSSKPESATIPAPQSAAPTKSVEKASTTMKSATAETAESQTGAPIAGLERPVSVHTDAKGRKWLGDVPYDVFFDNPLAVAAEGSSPASGGNNMLAA